MILEMSLASLGTSGIILDDCSFRARKVYLIKDDYENMSAHRTYTEPMYTEWYRKSLLFQ